MASRLDGIRNALTEVGTAADKRTADTEVAVDWPPLFLEHVYRSNDIGAKAVDLPVDDALRRGWSVEGVDEATRKRLSSRADDVGITKKLRDAAAWARCYGGAAVVVAPRPGTGSISEPAAPGNEVLWAESFRRDEIVVAQWGEDPDRSSFRKPLAWSLLAGRGEVRVHPSRVFHFSGPSAGYEHLRRQQGHGDSVLGKMLDKVWDFDHAWASVGILLRENGLTSLKLAGLAELKAEEGEELIKARLEVMRLAVKTLGVRLLDKEDEVAREGVPLAGVAEVLKLQAVRVAGTVGIPASRLFGEAPAGLNATGDSEIRVYYDTVMSWRENSFRLEHERAIRMLMLEPCSPTGGREPEAWRITYPAPWEPTDKEKSEAYFIRSQGDRNYYDMGALEPAEIRRARFIEGQPGGEIKVAEKPRRASPPPPLPGQGTPQIPPSGSEAAPVPPPPRRAEGG